MYSGFRYVGKLPSIHKQREIQRDFLSELNNCENFLQIGVGDGFELEELLKSNLFKQHNPKVYVCDIDLNFFNKSEHPSIRKYNGKIQTIQSSITDLKTKFNPSFFDVIQVGFVMHDIKESEMKNKVFSYLQSLLKPNGILIFSDSFIDNMPSKNHDAEIHRKERATELYDFYINEAKESMSSGKLKKAEYDLLLGDGDSVGILKTQTDAAEGSRDFYEDSETIVKRIRLAGFSVERVIDNPLFDSLKVIIAKKEMKFSSIYNDTYNSIKQGVRSANFNESWERLLNSNSQLSLEDVAEVLLSANENPKIKSEVIHISLTTREKKFHNSLSLIIPQYHSSKCIDNCKYCGFRKSNPNMLRVTLSDSDFEKEINLLIDWGYRCIEFVYATDPDFTAQRIGERVQVAKRIGKDREVDLIIGLNANSFTVEEYKILNQHGLDFMVLWIETYTEKYHDWHPKDTPKADFIHRIDTFDRVIQGGINKFGFGVLFGLGNWVHDVLMLIAHGLYLRKQYGIDPYIMGIPRLKQAMGLKIERSPWIIDDNDFEFVCYLFKLVFPNTKLFINTRENFEENYKLISGGGDLFTIDCGTFPGAYLNPKLVVEGFEQFHTQYYNRDTALTALKDKGFKPEFSWHL
jgi:2-iminoacetate synthase